MVYSQDDEGYLLVEDYLARCLYVDDQGVYFINSEDQYVLYHEDTITVFAENVWQAYQINHEIIYIGLDNQLYIYDMNTGNSVVLSEYADDFCVDDVNRMILYSDENSELKYIDFLGNMQDVKYYFDYYYDYYFYEGYVYYGFLDAIIKADLSTGEENQFADGFDFDDFAFSDDGAYIYYIYDETLYVYYKGESIKLVDGAKAIYPLGNQVIFYVYDDDYNEVYYLADAEGNYAKLE